MDEERMQRAFSEGQRAGHLRLASGLNPYPLGTPGAQEWQRAKQAVEARAIADAMRERARRVCFPCTCQGRGLCRDVA